MDGASAFIGFCSDTCSLGTWKSQVMHQQWDLGGVPVTWQQLKGTHVGPEADTLFFCRGIFWKER